jgi:hypothetical protein
MIKCTVVLALLFAITQADGAEYVYRIIAHDGTVQVQWHQERLEHNLIRVTSRNFEKKTYHEMLCDTNFCTLQWTYKDVNKNTDLKAQSADSVICVSGMIEGKEVNKSYKTEGVPWIQFQGLALGKIIDLPDKEVKCLIVRNSDAKLFKLRAEKKELQNIEVNGGSVEAFRVAVSLDGFLSMLGHVNFWFRQPDHIFVKYQGINGLSRKQPTVYELVEAVLQDQPEQPRPEIFLSNLNAAQSPVLANPASANKP